MTRNVAMSRDVLSSNMTGRPTVSEPNVREVAPQLRTQGGRTVAAAGDQRQQRWTASYEQLRGHLIEQGSYPTSTTTLGHWISSQRKFYRDGRLAADRLALLEALPGWEWRCREDQWGQSYQACRAYLAAHGTYPDRATTIGRWIVEQRMLYRQGGLRPDRRMQLDELPGWTFDPRDDLWARRYGELRAHLDLHETYPKAGTDLGIWIKHQRARNRKGALCADRVVLLDALPGWKWSRAR